jgi:hypothetical protein
VGSVSLRNRHSLGGHGEYKNKRRKNISHDNLPNLQLKNTILGTFGLAATGICR